MNWLCQLLTCRDHNLENLYQAWLDRYRDELMRQVDHSEELLRERKAKAAEIERLTGVSEQAKTLYREALTRAVKAETEIERLRLAIRESVDAWKRGSDIIAVSILNAALNTEAQE